MGIALISLASAVYPGETIIEPHSLGTDNLVYTIVGNSSELIVLPDVTINSTHVIIYFPTDMPPNDFIIVFLEEQTKEVIKEIHVSSGGGGGTTYVDKEVIVEVPNYIKEEVEVIKEIIKEVPSEPEVIKKVPFWVNFVYCIIIILLVYFLVRSTRKHDGPNHDELKRGKGEVEGWVK